MPKLSPEELQDARRKKAEQRRVAEEENARLDSEYAERRRQEEELHDKYQQLKSYVDGLHDEAGKLSSKRPNEATTDLVVKSTNYAIESAKKLIPEEDDVFLAGLKQFVSTDKQVENRDITFALRQVKDALERLRARKEWKTYWVNS